MGGWTLGVIGAGNMGEALVRGVLAAGVVEAGRVVVADPRPEATARLAAELGVGVAADNGAAVAGADVVLLCVKPQVLPAVLAGVADLFGPSRLLISIAAGIPLAALEAPLPEGVPVVRVMPNTPSLVGAGASAYCRGRHAGPEHGRRTAEILEAVGIAVEVGEEHMDAVTALSGSGPAYVFYVLEHLQAGGEALGLPADLARRLAGQTLLGAARLVLETGRDAADLRRAVTSPGGTTEAALKVLQDRGFGEALQAALVAARDRGAELGRR